MRKRRRRSRKIARHIRLVDALGREVEAAYTAWPFHKPGRPGRLQTLERRLATGTVVRVWKRYKRKYGMGNQRRRGWLS